MQPSSSFPDSEILDRFLAGDASPVDEALVQQWLGENPDLQSQLATIRASLVDPFGPVPAYDHDARVAAAVDFSARSARRARIAEPRPVRSAPPMWRRMASYGAALGIAAAVVFAIRVTMRPHTASAPVTTYTTANGQRALVTLSDGSTAMLNVASRLDVPADFATGNRALRAEGQVLFHVAHKNGTPFTVATGKTVTRVLGTTFMVRRYDTDTLVTVAVRDGRVGVGTAVLSANQRAAIDNQGRLSFALADSAEFAFENNTLSIPWMSLASAIPDLNRWYDAEIRLADPKLATRRIQTVGAPGTVATLVSTLELALHVRVERSGKVLTLYPR